jgi:membrane-bound lytic murein transglycosylase D
MKIIKSFLTLCISSSLLLTTDLQAQENVKNTDAIVIGSKAVEDSTSEPTVVYPYDLIVFDERDKQQYTIKVEDPRIVEQRLKNIQIEMPMVYNSNVKLWLDFFMIRRPSFTKKMLEDKDYFFPIYEKILAKNNMPIELKYLSILESGLNPKAVSRSKAVGLWQFMSFTGKEMGLDINEYVDERMHIEKSTEAACKYLRQLYAKFNDWELALASYNTGPNRIARVIKNTGLTSYWDLHPHIHPDTRAYVPQFIALAYIMNFANEHGIFADQKRDFVPVEKIVLNQHVNLKVLADLAHIDLEDLKRHNPHIKTGILPEVLGQQELAIPLDKMAYFNQYRQMILDSAARKPEPKPLTVGQEVLANRDAENGSFKKLEDGTIVIGGKTPAVAVNEELEEDIVRYKSVLKQVKKYHKVKKGEFLIRIADRYNVTPGEIKRWNKLRSNNVKYGTKLLVYVNEKQKVKTVEKVAKKKGKESQVSEEKLAENKEQSTDKKVAKTESKKAKTKKEIQAEKEEKLAANKKKKEEEKEAYRTYTVKKGDTLWNISQRFDGVTVDDIKKMNKIKGNQVMVGQKIKIKS